MAFGPIQIVALGFPTTDRFEGRIAEELFKASDAGIIRWIGVQDLVTIGAALRAADEEADD